MQDAKPQPMFVSVKTFARLTDSPVATVRSWINRGVIPVVRIGGTVKIPVAVLESLAAENKEG